MKLTIDTKEDSVDDIRRMMHILSDILARKGGGAVAGDTDTTTLMSMFDSSPQSAPSMTAPPEGSLGMSTALNLAEGSNPGKKEERARIEFY